MKLSIYKNPRSGHTYQVNRKGDRYMIVERDWMGDLFQVMAFYNRLENAQDVLDKLCDSMDWRFCVSLIVDAVGLTASVPRTMSTIFLVRI